MNGVVLKGYILVSDHDLPNVLEELPNHIALTEQEEGCIVFRVTRSKQNPNRFDVYEEFTDMSALEEHNERIRTSSWGKVTLDVKRYYKILS
ncbi:antibiotic biosynthesis monooxygenase [Vibrio sp. S4M6]|uniref:putative quinol monooxygenase n=1 Tax=Vibrio sinus TaxID=2946865 RepID=UPI00202A8E69|nr:antibiotic biosynthesis monooxygenase [Vibrio sinus]MCL9782257.1 antibiotic biosynthesis monooxygenase [Vibrio sinus]